MAVAGSPQAGSLARLHIPADSPGSAGAGRCPGAVHERSRCRPGRPVAILAGWTCQMRVGLGAITASRVPARASRFRLRRGPSRLDTSMAETAKQFLARGWGAANQR